MSQRGSPPPDPDLQRLNDFIAECILAIEQDGEAAMETLLAQNPDLAKRASARLRGLRTSGLLSEPAKDPERIGPYRILQRLGAGGMGTVYLAEQNDTLERRVALKVIKPGMDSREVLARFSIERQALAMLDHQNIAKALDAGQTDDGRPFLVMEYVSGLPITRYCDERRLSVPERIELFCLVCEAVQHAHHKGLIHRDLKPSNILVADRDGKPWPMVIDFGVAKSLTGRLTDQSLVTMRGCVLGTLEYMSPEQAANELDVDTRTDVFSLGVVLYELLTGTLPIDSQTLRRASSLEMQRILRDTDAPAPSQRVTATGTAAQIALLRDCDGLRLRRRLRGDLDWVTLRALERDRNRRYGMPGELAADLQRHLHDEPVLAGPPSSLYRWSKFLARNRLQVGSAAAVLLALLVGLGVSWSAYRAAAASARQSDIDFGHGVAAIERLVFFGDERLVDEPQMDEVRRQMLTDALSFYENVAAGRTDDKRLDQRVAQARARIGRLQLLLGNFDAALVAVDQALAQFRALQASPDAPGAPGAPGAPEAKGIAGIEFLRGQILLGLGRTAQAEAAMRTAVETYRTPPLEVRSLLIALDQLARTLRRRDRAAARTVYEEALAAAEPFLSGPAVDSEELPTALLIAAQHGLLLVEMGELAVARQSALALRTRLSNAMARTTAQRHQAYGEACSELGVLCSRLKEHEPATSLLEQAAELLRTQHAAHPAQVRWARQLGIVLNNLADVHMLRNLGAQAIVAEAESVRVFEALFTRYPVGSHQAMLGKVLLNQVRITQAPAEFGGEIDTEAVAAGLQRAVDLLHTLPPEQRCERDTRLALAHGWAMRAAEHERALRTADALADMQRSVDELAAISVDDPTLMPVREEWAALSVDLMRLLIGAGKSTEALAIGEQVLAAADAIEATSPTAQPGSYARLVSRWKMQACARLGDVDGTRREIEQSSGIANDWNGNRYRAEALLLLVEQLPANDARRTALLGEARSLLQEALGFGDTMDASMGAMVAVMSAQTQEILVRLARTDGDLLAATAAAEAVVDGYEPSFRSRAIDKNRRRLAAAAEVWLQLLLERRQTAALAGAIERMGTAFARHGPELLRLAEWSALLVQLHAGDTDAATAAAASGISLLRACIGLGTSDLPAIQQSPALAALRSHPDFASLGSGRR